jgi:hypothetical protein
MDDDNRVHAWVAIVALVVGLVLGVGIGWRVTQDNMQADLVKRGVGEWKVVDQFGRTEFRYISIESSPKH